MLRPVPLQMVPLGQVIAAQAGGGGGGGGDGTFTVGQPVEAKWDNDRWYDGTVAKVNGDGTYTIFWPQWKNQSERVPGDQIRSATGKWGKWGSDGGMRNAPSGYEWKKMDVGNRVGIGAVRPWQGDLPALPTEEAFDPNNIIRLVKKKRVVEGDNAEYLVEWQDLAREPAWVSRNDLIKIWRNRGIVGKFENQLLEDVKEHIRALIEEEGKLSLPDLGKYIKTDWPMFQFKVHKLRNLSALVRTIPEYAKVEVETRFVFSNREYGKQIRARSRSRSPSVQEKTKRDLYMAYADLVGVIKLLGGSTKMSRIGAAFRQAGYQKFNAREYGFKKFRDFVTSCPGVYVDPKAFTAPVPVKLEDENPKELREFLGRRTFTSRRSRSRSPGARRGRKSDFGRSRSRSRDRMFRYK